MMCCAMREVFVEVAFTSHCCDALMCTVGDKVVEIPE